jgi:hypothetical protein
MIRDDLRVARQILIDAANPAGDLAFFLKGVKRPTKITSP